MYAADEKIQKSGQEKEGIGGPGDRLGQGEQDRHPTDDEERPDQLRAHGGGSAQHRTQQKDHLPGIAVGAGQQKTAVQPVLHLPQKGGEEEQRRQNGTLHAIFYLTRPAGRQAAKAVKIQPQDSPPRGTVKQIP